MIADAALAAPDERMDVAAAVLERDELMCSFVNCCWRQRAIFSFHHLPKVGYAASGLRVALEDG